jgi:hypothetical protein
VASTVPMAAPWQAMRTSPKTTRALPLGGQQHVEFIA